MYTVLFTPMSRARYFVLFVALLVAVQWSSAASLPKSSPRKNIHPAAKKNKDKEKAHESKALRERIDAILSQPDIARGFWGVEAVSLTTGKTLYTYNGDKLFTPASNTKIFTTAAALALIGPDYQFKTTVETTGTLDKYGRLSGDVVLVGRGDPNLSGRTLPYQYGAKDTQPPMIVLQELADQLIRKGVRYIDGDIVGDDTFYAFERYADGWSQDDMSREWGAPVSALTVNDNVQFVRVQPGANPGEKAFVDIEPFPDYYQLDNRIMTTPAGTGPRNVNITREPGSHLLTLWGTIPADDPGFNESLAIDDPADFAARVFRRMLEERGVTVYGKARAKHLEVANLSTFIVTARAQSGGGDIPNGARTIPPLVLAAYQSKPLLDDLTLVNKVSQNLHAELLLRLLGREKGTAGTIEAGSEVLRGFLTRADIRSDEYVFYDGSGLSRQNLVTPHAIVKMLLYASQQPWGAQYASTFPIGGVDGTLADRFRTPDEQGKIEGKTGSLSHVSTLSGYATTDKGDRIAFSVMANNYHVPASVAMQAIDQIVGALVEDGSQHKK
jgi:D-alanyl-D-alanine carboxypeptidase/D-alanyl-D-alanine-endopeptidase (penicillin-binding protein 4)